MREVFIDEWIFGALISMIMNSLLLWATGRIQKKKSPWWRLLLAGAIGGIYYFWLCYRLELGVIGESEIFLFVGIGVLMLILAFSPNSIKELFRMVSLFLLITLLSSGVTYFFLNPPFLNKRVSYGTWEVILVNLFSLLIVTELGWGLIHQLYLEKGCLFSIRLSVNGLTTDLSALLDTGNMLVDPINGHPVMVVEAKSLQGVLPPEMIDLNNILARGEFPENSALDFSPDWAARIRLITYTSVGREKGFLLGFRPDEIILLQKEPHKLPPVLVGLYNFTASGSSYQALLPSSLLTEFY